MIGEDSVFMNATFNFYIYLKDFLFTCILECVVALSI